MHYSKEKMAEMPGGLHGWTRSSWTNSSRKRRPTEDGNKDK